ncbi:MAG: dockerin type I domain-containing protein [Pirellulaceae bacterium]|nr:dockerin type I domain-containing protein [Pirellulaceae bacterium]
MNSWDYEFRDVVIIDENNEVVTTYNLTSNNLSDSENYAELRQLFVDAASESQANPWHNADNPLDVNADSFISPLDALLVINELNNAGARELGTPSGEVTVYFDTNDNRFVEPLDALLVLNELNKTNVDEGEGENALDASPVDLQLDNGSLADSGHVPTLAAQSVDRVFQRDEMAAALELVVEDDEKNSPLRQVASTTVSNAPLELELLGSV